MFSSDQLMAILGSLPDPAFVLTRSGRYAAVFGGTDARYYHDGRALVGRSLHDVLSADKARWFLGEIATALAGRQLHIVEYGLSGRDVLGLSEEGPEDLLWFEGRVQALSFPVEGEEAVLWVASNITARHEMELRLRTLSETDPLTGLANRRRLSGRLQECHDLHMRYGVPATAFVFDLDRLKSINDEFGHDFGDRVLQTVAAVCLAALRATDLVARVGGDEFVVLMPQTTVEQAQVIAERLRFGVAAAVAELGVSAQQATLSGGLSEFAAGDESGDDMVRRADEWLYQAKSTGRDRIVTGVVA